jgi:hypothetical protein
VLEAELLTLPQCKTDDQVDRISQALARHMGFEVAAIGRGAHAARETEADAIVRLEVPEAYAKMMAGKAQFRMVLTMA